MIKTERVELVSVIMPTYNASSTIIDSILTVLSQSYKYWELLIVDDCSSIDKPNGFFELVESDDRINYIKRTWNAGPAVTRNRAISASKGRFIAFLDSDDLWHPHKLEIQVNFMLSNNVSLSYSSYEVIDTRGNTLGLRTPPEQLSYDDVLKSNQIGCLTAMYDTEKVGKVYMPNIAKRQDMGLWLKILKQIDFAKGITNRSLARYRVGTNSVSSNKLSVLKYQWRIYREVEKLPIIKSLNYFRHYAYRGLKRKV